MNARHISDAVEVLNEAGRMLRRGGASVEEQMAVGGRCYEIAGLLQRELQKIGITVKVPA